MVTSWLQRERPRKQRRVRLLRTDGRTEAEAGIAAGPFFLSFYVHRSVAEGAEGRKKGTRGRDSNRRSVTLVWWLINLAGAYTLAVATLARPGHG